MTNTLLGSAFAAVAVSGLLSAAPASALTTLTTVTVTGRLVELIEENGISRYSLRDQVFASFTYNGSAGEADGSGTFSFGESVEIPTLVDFSITVGQYSWIAQSVGTNQFSILIGPGGTFLGWDGMMRSNVLRNFRNLDVRFDDDLEVRVSQTLLAGSGGGAMFDLELGALEFIVGNPGSFLIDGGGAEARMAFRSFQQVQRVGEARGVLNGAIAVIPEPATWAMMIAGFGLVGASLRRRQLLAA